MSLQVRGNRSSLIVQYIHLLNWFRKADAMESKLCIRPHAVIGLCYALYGVPHNHPCINGDEIQLYIFVSVQLVHSTCSAISLCWACTCNSYNSSHIQNAVNKLLIHMYYNHHNLEKILSSNLPYIHESELFVFFPPLAVRGSASSPTPSRTVWSTGSAPGTGCAPTTWWSGGGAEGPSLTTSRWSTSVSQVRRYSGVSWIDIRTGVRLFVILQFPI